MLDNLGNAGEAFKNLDIGTTLVILGIIAVFVAAVWYTSARNNRKRKAQTQGASTRSATIASAVKAAKIKDKKEPVKAEPAEEEVEATEEEKTSLIGTGKFKAMVFLANGEDIDFTTIPEPIGHIHQFDTSMPLTGGGYIVKECSDGSLIAYDPRDVAMETTKLPDWAWFAINCRDIVKRFWMVPAPWWKSVAMWLAAGVIAVDFICFLAIFG